jgi:hypothetical protein
LKNTFSFYYESLYESIGGQIPTLLTFIFSVKTYLIVDSAEPGSLLSLRGEEEIPE